MLPRVLLNKTAVCEHKYGCFENVIRRALANFCMGYALQFIVKNIFMLAKPAKMLRNL